MNLRTSFSLRAPLALLIAAFMVCMGACSTTSIVASEDAATADGLCPMCHQTTWAYFWGIVEPSPIDPQCGTGTMTKVRAKTNLGFAIIAVVSGGLVMPQSVEWDCAPRDVPIGEIPIPMDDIPTDSIPSDH